MTTIRKKRVEWTEYAILILLDCWEERVEDLRKAKRNMKIFEEISAKLEIRGVFKSPQEISTKIANLTKKCRREKLCVAQSGGAPSLWCYFENVNRIIGGFPSHEDPLGHETDISMDSNETATSLPPNQSQTFPSTSTYKEEIDQPGEEKDITEDSGTSAGFFETPNTFSKRRNKSVSTHEELLREIKRANQAAEHEMRVANEIARQSLTIQREMLEFFKKQKN